MGQLHTTDCVEAKMMTKKSETWLNEVFAGLRLAIKREDREAYLVQLEMLEKNWELLLLDLDERS